MQFIHALTLTAVWLYRRLSKAWMRNYIPHFCICVIRYPNRSPSLLVKMPLGNRQTVNFSSHYFTRPHRVLHNDISARYDQINDIFCQQLISLSCVAMPLHGVRLLQANTKGIQWRQLAPFCSQNTQLKAFGIPQGCSLTPVLNIHCHYWKWYIRTLWSILSLYKVSKHSSMANYIKVQSLTPNYPLKFHLDTIIPLMQYMCITT